MSKQNKQTKNNTRIKDRNVMAIEDSKIDYGYNFTPSLAKSPNQDEQKEKTNELEKISRKRE